MSISRETLQMKGLGRKNRESNIELLRIISMLFVMTTHVTLAIGYPDIENATGVEYYLIGLIKALSIISVNIFVMISGWFGIKFTLKKFFSFVFQILFSHWWATFRQLYSTLKLSQLQNS